MTVRVQTADFDAGREIAALRARDPRVGAVASFIGTVRDVNDSAHVSTLTLEHYPGMTEKALEAIVAEAAGRFDIFDALVIHRVGTLAPDRSDRAGGGDQCASRRGIRCLPLSDGLPEDPRAVLEKGNDAPRRTLGRCACQRRRGRRTLGTSVRSSLTRIAESSPCPPRRSSPSTGGRLRRVPIVWTQAGRSSQHARRRLA